VVNYFFLTRTNILFRFFALHENSVNFFCFAGIFFGFFYNVLLIVDSYFFCVYLVGESTEVLVEGKVVAFGELKEASMVNFLRYILATLPF